MSHFFAAECMNRSARCNMRWYQNNLVQVLRAAKEKQARGMTEALVMANELLEKLNEKVDQPTIVPMREVPQSEDDSLMTPIEPEVLDILYGATEKGGGDRYLKERFKKSPEERFRFRIVTSWDYGWQQKQSRQRARDVNRGRCAILRDTFYRKRNLGPDPQHYAKPSGGEVTICSEYSCDAN